MCAISEGPGEEKKDMNKDIYEALGLPMSDKIMKCDYNPTCTLSNFA
jgi:hypothetical protein